MVKIDIYYFLNIKIKLKLLNTNIITIIIINIIIPKKAIIIDIIIIIITIIIITIIIAVIGVIIVVFIIITVIVIIYYMEISRIYLFKIITTVNSLRFIASFFKTINFVFFFLKKYQTYSSNFKFRD
jgi:hypothetical protein